MPVFTVTVQGPNGQTKIVTVNTDNMSAEVVPNTASSVESIKVPNASVFAPGNGNGNASNPFLQPEVSPAVVDADDHKAFTNNEFIAAPVGQVSPSVPAVASNLPHNFQEGVDPWANNAPNVESSPVKKGGKRSTRIFRSKKKRTTRKLRR